MVKHIRYRGARGEWSEWVQPTMTGYRLTCCSCGLAHDVEFVALKVLCRHANGLIESQPLPIEQFKVGFRMRRNNRATGQVRRWMKNDE